MAALANFSFLKLCGAMLALSSSFIAQVERMSNTYLAHFLYNFFSKNAKVRHFLDDESNEKKGSNLRSFSRNVQKQGNRLLRKQFGFHLKISVSVQQNHES